MDRALKERITGAVVLVVIAILVVPVFLDGTPSGTEIVTETVTLPGQDEQRRKQQTIVLERDRDQPVPSTPIADTAAADSAAETREAEAAPAVAAARPEPEPVPPPAAAGESETEAAQQPPPVEEEETEPARVARADAEPETSDESATGMWAVQLGSFSNKENAQRLASTLRSDGYAAFLSQLTTSRGELHRVRVGPQQDRDSAEAVARRLSGNGHEGQVVPHP